MSFLKVKNRAFSTLASGVDDTTTSWTLATGEGSKFPTTGDFHITCEDEIVKCTSRSGDVLTVVRAQEGTAAAAHVSGKAVELRVTAGIIEELQSPFSLPELIKQSNFIMIPTAAGWTETVTGAGATYQQPMRNYVVIGDTNAGSALLYAAAFGFNIGGHYGYMNWGKHLFLIFNYTIYDTEASLTRRIQLKETSALGQLAQKGVGFQVVNLAMTGEAYGTERGTVSLGNIEEVADPIYKQIQVVIELDPGVAVNFYINRSLVDSIITTAQIPSGVGAAGLYLVHSIDRSGGGATNVSSFLMQGKIWQE